MDTFIGLSVQSNRTTISNLAAAALTRFLEEPHPCLAEREAKQPRNITVTRSIQHNGFHTELEIHIHQEDDYRQPTGKYVLWIAGEAREQTWCEPTDTTSEYDREQAAKQLHETADRLRQQVTQDVARQLDDLRNLAHKFESADTINRLLNQALLDLAAEAKA
jgi:hypothetical protein